MEEQNNQEQGIEIVPTPKIENQTRAKSKTISEVDSFLKLRKQFITKVNAICVEGKDYHIIKDRKSLAKGGAEKIASIFKWTAKFEKDTDSLEMLGNLKGLVAFKCTLENGQFVGEGRGAASLIRNANDPNKTLKMAQKSAFIDAVLRASGLSDFFTQDLEDMPVLKNNKPKPAFRPVVANNHETTTIQKNNTPIQKNGQDYLVRLKNANSVPECIRVLVDLDIAIKEGKFKEVTAKALKFAYNKRLNQIKSKGVNNVQKV